MKTQDAGRGRGGHTNGAPQIARLPPISCREPRLRSATCGLFKENQISGRGKRGEVENPATLLMTSEPGGKRVAHSSQKKA
jgi:hypothetical protein